MQIPPEVEKIEAAVAAQAQTIVADVQAEAGAAESKGVQLWKDFRVELISVAIVIVLAIALTFIK